MDHFNVRVVDAHAWLSVSGRGESGRVGAWRGTARQGTGEWHPLRFEAGAPTLGVATAWQGSARRGVAWRGVVRRGTTRRGKAWAIRVDGLRCGSTPHHPRKVWHREAMPGKAWCRLAGHGMQHNGGRLAVTWVRDPGAHARPVRAGHGWAWLGTAKRGEVWLDMAALGKARNTTKYGRAAYTKVQVLGAHAWLGIASAVLGPAALGWARRGVASPGMAWSTTEYRASGTLPRSSRGRLRTARPRLARQSGARRRKAGHGSQQLN